MISQMPQTLTLNILFAFFFELLYSIINLKIKLFQVKYFLLLEALQTLSQKV